MHLPNREQWKFTATPRELQFFVAGIAAGTILLAIIRALAAPPAEGYLFILGLPLAVLFVVLAMARSQ